MDSLEGTKKAKQYEERNEEQRRIGWTAFLKTHPSAKKIVRDNLSAASWPTDRASKSSYKAPGAMTRTSRVLKGMLVRAE